MVPRLSAIPSGPNAYSKESRDAALRERGLLPPLRPNKDLSAQEQEQDRAIPIVLPKDDPPSSTEPDAPSAADLIKKEWEAKNRSLESTQLLRMNSFKFGGTSLDTPKEFSSDSLTPDTPTPPSREFLPSPIAEAAVPQPSSSSSLIAPVVPSSPIPVSPPGSRPVTPLLDIPPEIAAYLYPLPPSPRSILKPKSELSSRPPSPTSVPLPPSPTSCSVYDTTSLRSASGAHTFSGPLDIREAPPTPTPPIIALTPCATIFPESDLTDNVISSPLHTRTDLPAPLDDSLPSSIQTPSLDSNSHTTTSSTLGTSESVAICGKGRLSGLRIKTQEGCDYNIPVIVESPIEDSFLEEQYQPTSTFDDDEPVPMTAPIGTSELGFLLSVPRMKKRGLTDPTNGSLDRKKSTIMNPFKRGLSSGYGDVSLTPLVEPTRRPSVKTSLSNMRRTVIGTLSRKSTSPGRKVLDASHLPPSPIFPLPFSKLHSPTSPTYRTEEGEIRRAVSPTVYSRGHILMEASHIKDEESRRMTEMAFLT